MSANLSSAVLTPTEIWPRIDLHRRVGWTRRQKGARRVARESRRPLRPIWSSDDFPGHHGVERDRESRPHPCEETERRSPATAVPCAVEAWRSNRAGALSRRVRRDRAIIQEIRQANVRTDGLVKALGELEAKLSRSPKWSWSAAAAGAAATGALIFLAIEALRFLFGGSPYDAAPKLQAQISRLRSDVDKMQVLLKRQREVLGPNQDDCRMRRSRKTLPRVTARSPTRLTRGRTARRYRLSRLGSFRQSAPRTSRQSSANVS